MNTIMTQLYLCFKIIYTHNSILWVYIILTEHGSHRKKCDNIIGNGINKMRACFWLLQNYIYENTSILVALLIISTWQKILLF